MDIGARLLHATGVSSAGDHGEAHRTVPYLFAGPLAGFAVLSRLEVRATVGPEVDLLRQRFALSGVPVADLGHVRAHTGISLVVWLP